jgi:hypothetical protein
VYGKKLPPQYAMMMVRASSHSADNERTPATC